MKNSVKLKFPSFNKIDLFSVCYDEKVSENDFLEVRVAVVFCNGWIIYSSDCRLELQVKVKHCQSIGNVGFVESLTPLCNGTLNICSYRKSHFNKKICCCHFDKLEAMDLKLKRYGMANDMLICDGGESFYFSRNSCTTWQFLYRTKLLRTISVEPTTL